VKAAWVDSEELQRSLAIEEARSILLAFHAQVHQDAARRLKRNDLSPTDLANEIRLALSVAALNASPDEVMLLAAQLHDIQEHE
jgi:hypothetical protein